MFKRMQSLQMQGVHCFQYKSYRAIIAIHNTRLGPALGGCRCLHYENENQAFDDAMRLARGMSYKAALANVANGGGKSVILLPKSPVDRQELFSWFGDCVEQLQGQYITAMDSGTQVADMDVIAQRTQYVASASNIGDPAPYTAQGVLAGIEAALKFKCQKELAASRIAIQGLGHVGMSLLKKLLASGAEVIVTDQDRDKCDEALQLGAIVVSPEDILSVAVDVFSPCALGGVLTQESISGLQAKIVAGSANNQLAEDDLGDLLMAKGILYAPDYIINSGGLIYASSRYHHASDGILQQKISAISDTLTHLFFQAQKANCAVTKIADETAQTILAGEPLIAEKLTSHRKEVHHAA